jgi:hypothetical protein
MPALTFPRCTGDTTQFATFAVIAGPLVLIDGQMGEEAGFRGVLTNCWP